MYLLADHAKRGSPGTQAPAPRQGWQNRLARISQKIERIGGRESSKVVVPQRLFLDCRRPRCRQSVRRDCLNVKPSGGVSWWPWIDTVLCTVLHGSARPALRRAQRRDGGRNGARRQAQTGAAGGLRACARSIVWSTRRNATARSTIRSTCNGGSTGFSSICSWNRISGRRGRSCLIWMRLTSRRTDIKRATSSVAITTTAASCRVLRSRPAAFKTGPLEYRR